MNRYKKHMQKVHNVGTATSIEMAVLLIIEDVVDHLIKTGVKADSKLLKDIRGLQSYEYKKPEIIK
jgi:hypothetical protein